jgi:hypothetical protein
VKQNARFVSIAKGILYAMRNYVNKKGQDINTINAVTINAGYIWEKCHKPIAEKNHASQTNVKHGFTTQQMKHKFKKQ